MAKKGLRIVMDKLHRSLSSKKLTTTSNVPGDVKEGHIAVIAANDHQQRRFIVPLSYLAHPAFLALLENAAEEYGFDRKGALTIPCCPTELDTLLAEQSTMLRSFEDARFDWGSYKATIKSF